MANQVLKLRANDYNADLPPSDTGAEQWTNGSNVVFRNGVTQLAPGWSHIYETVQSDIRAMQNIQLGGINFWVYHGSDSSHVVETTNHTNITLPAGVVTTTEPNKMSVGTLNGIPFFNNRSQAPMYWAGETTTPFQELPNFPTSTVVRHMVAFKFHLFGFGTDEPAGEFPLKIIWSDAAEPGSVPGTWTAAADNQAGDVIIADGGEFYQTAVPLRDTLIIYKNTSTHAADYVGGNDIYAFRMLFPNTGALTSRSVVDIGGEHFVVTDGDIILTDGTQKRSIADRRVKDYLFETLEADTYQRLFVVYWQAKQEVWVCYPGTGSTYCDEALIYDINNDKWSTPRSLNNVTCGAVGIVEDGTQASIWNDDPDYWDEDVSVWNELTFPLQTQSLVLGALNLSGSPETLPTAGSPVGSGSPIPELGFMQEITGTTENLTLTTATIGKYRMDFGDPMITKNVFQLVPKVKATENSLTFQFRVGSSKTDVDTITWDKWRNFLVGTTEYIDVDLKENGRFISIEGRTTEADPWELIGIDFFYRPEGYF